MKKVWRVFSVLIFLTISLILVRSVEAIYLEETDLKEEEGPKRAHLEIYNPSVVENSPVWIGCSVSDPKGVNTSRLFVRTPSNEKISSQCDKNFLNTSEVGTYVINYTVRFKDGSSVSNFTWFKAYPSDRVESTSWSKVKANESKILETGDSIGFQKLQFSLKKNFSYLTIRAKNFMKKPELEEKPASGLVYQYFRIKNQSIEDKDVREAEITLSVSKPWLNTNGIVRVFLERYEKGEWRKYQASQTKEETNDIVYKAKVPGFSYFAISGEKGVQECSEGKYRCLDNSLERCKNDSWQLVEVCEYGCNTTDFTCNPGPVEEVCETGSKRCFEGNLQGCKENGWETVETCEYGCNSSTLSCDLKPEEDICEGGTKRCFKGKLQECKGDGWELVKACNYGCNSSTLNCNPGPEREPSEKIGGAIVIGIIFLMFLSFYFFSKES